MSLAFVCHLVFEAPFAALDKIIFPIAKSDENKTKEPLNDKPSTASSGSSPTKRALSPSRELSKNAAIHAYRPSMDAPLAMNNNNRLQSSHM